ncbi:hypothetical protein DN752_10385 [Echinicola strongylocentroti]|uniref:Uncharacterized protein n=1 Tax=Echinicola strongylocentroti TaxID=1795355 RepID=A0A2Z4IIZ2_9BACT|nr:hypothetical protein [Echinicola strongylocentroti]AWW30498.1 hypothetical protein DN752_10385 [Echinicola strongylocentroti]
MKTQPQTSKAYFKNLTMLHGVLLVAQIAFFTAAFFFTDRSTVSNEELNSLFTYLAPVLVFAGIAGSNLLFRKQLAKLMGTAELKAKLGGYLSSLVIKYALLEMPAMLSIVAYFITANYLFLGTAVVVLIVFILDRPSMGKAVADLQLSVAERQKVENPNEEVAEVNVR